MSNLSNDASAKNAVIYARFSSHSQNEQSIEGQLRICHDYAQRNGYAVVGEYIDRVISGRSDDRPDFQRMISDARKKAFQYVIVYKLDRFARNRYDSAIYKYKLKQCGVKVLSAMENIGDSPESIILEAVLEASAEYYSVDLSQKIKRGRHDSAAKGKFIGGTVPLGYRSVGGALEVDPRTAPIVQYVFAEYAKGERKTRIIDALREKGWRTRDGKPFTLNSLTTLLKNPKYIGVLQQSGVSIEGGCPAIVEPEVFEQVQRRLAQNRKQGAKNKAKMEYLLTGKLFCGYCGAGMQGVSGTGRDGDRRHYYQCPTRRNRKTCHKHNEKKDFLEWYVVEQTIDYVLDPARIHTIAARVAALYAEDFNNGKVEELQKRIDQADREINKAVDLLMDVPKEGRAPLYARIERFGAEKADLEIDLAKLKVASGIRVTEKEILAWMKSFCRGDLFDMEFRKRIIDVFINAIYLYDDKVVLYYNIKDGKQVSYIEMLESSEEAEDLDDVENDGASPETEEKASGDLPKAFSCGFRISSTLVEHTGFEPVTSTLPVWHSSQLS